MRMIMGTILRITFVVFLISLTAFPVRAQLTERPLGLQFEEQGFLSMPGVLAYDSGRNRLAIADKGSRLVYIFDLTDKTYLSIGADRDFPEPAGLAFDSRGSLFISLEKSPYLLIYNLQAEIPDTLYLNSILPSELKKPGRIYIDHDGFKYLLDNEKNDIIIINSEGNYVRAISDKLKRPDGIIMTNSGQLIIADKGFDPILVFNPNFEFERRFTRPQSPTSQFSFSASGLAIDHRGWIYTLDITRNKVITFDPTGVNQTEWAPENSAFFPVDIAIDRYDHIFISDSGSGSVRTFVRGE